MYAQTIFHSDLSPHRTRVSAALMIIVPTFCPQSKVNLWALYGSRNKTSIHYSTAIDT
jgi:hypothetical protein